MRALLVACVLIAALAPLASAQAPKPAAGIVIVVEPASLRAAPGTTHETIVVVKNGGNDTLTARLDARAGGAVNATLATLDVKVPPGSAVRVPMRVAVARAAVPGPVVVEVVAHLGAATDARAATTTVGKLEVRVVAPPVPLAADAAAPEAAHAPAASAAAPIADPRVAGAAAVAATAGAGVAGFAWARRRWGAWAFLAPLYSRLARHRMLDHPVRDRMLRIVQDEPGVSFSELARRLDVGAGTLTHHARMLERAGVVFSSPDGQTRRFFPTTFGRVAPVPSLAERAVERLRAGPATLSTLAEALGVTRQALHYHVKKLVAEGRVESRSDGRDVLLALRG